MLSPHGIPVDLLDRLVIIRTLQYVLEEIIAILNTRAKVSPPHPAPGMWPLLLLSTFATCHAYFVEGSYSTLFVLLRSLTCNLFW